MRKFAIAAAALAFTGTAYAADMPLLKAPPMMVAPPSWTGFYIGANGGWVGGQTNTGIGFLNCPYVGQVCPQDTALASNAIKNSGGLAGGQIGYLLQQGSLVGGFEASLDWFHATGSVSNSAPIIGFPANTATWTESARTNWLALFTARAGVDMGAWYPYVTGGLAVGSLNYSVAFSDNSSNTSTAIALSQVRLGYAGGAGLEWRWDSHWSLRGEYLYVVFNGVNGNSPIIANATGLQVIAAAGPSSVNHSASFNENIARAAVSYRF